MNDLISRQSVIDALKAMEVPRYLDAACEDIWERDRTLDNAIDVIHALPSAQLEIVRCGQCKYAEVADAQDNQDGYTCQFHRGSIWFSGSYCSWGERRTDE